ncbi:Protein of unknown function, partial [Gryllus bimaculatus]
YKSNSGPTAVYPESPCSNFNDGGKGCHDSCVDALLLTLMISAVSMAAQTSHLKMGKMNLSECDTGHLAAFATSVWPCSKYGFGTRSELSHPFPRRITKMRHEKF